MKAAFSTRIWMAYLLSLALGLILVTPAFAQAPANDDFDDSISIGAIPFTDATDTTEATSAADDPVPSCVETTHTVWYQYTPAEDLSLAANTFGSDYDTTLSVFTGERGSLTEIACNDDTFSLESRVVFEAQAGVTYFFMVGSFFDSPGGQMVFTVDVAPPPLEFDLRVDSVGLVRPKTGVVTITGEVECSRLATVDIFLSVEQRIGRFIIQGFGGTLVENCEGSTPWSITVTGENGIYVGGKADVSAFANAFTEFGEFAFDEEFLTVKLRGSPGKP